MTRLAMTRSAHWLCVYFNRSINSNIVERSSVLFQFHPHPNISSQMVLSSALFSLRSIFFVSLSDCSVFSCIGAFASLFIECGVWRWCGNYGFCFLSTVVNHKHHHHYNGLILGPGTFVNSLFWMDDFRSNQIASITLHFITFQKIKK